jgi:hypothetical protein
MQKKIYLMCLIASLHGTHVYAQTWSGSIPSYKCDMRLDVVGCSITTTKTLLDELYAYVPSNEYVDVYLPIVISAQDAEDLLNVLGPWSNETRAAVLNLLTKLETILPQIDKLLLTPAQNRTARDLKIAMRKIRKEIYN